MARERAEKEFAKGGPRLEQIANQQLSSVYTQGQSLQMKTGNSLAPLLSAKVGNVQVTPQGLLVDLQAGAGGTGQADFTGNLDLKPGQFAKIRALLENRQGAILVPQRAIVDVQGSKSVYVVGKDNRIEAKAVTIGGSKDGSFVIDAGLIPTDMVVVEGVSKVRPGATVKVVPAPDAASAAPAAAPDAAPAAAKQ